MLDAQPSVQCAVYTPSWVDVKGAGRRAAAHQVSGDGAVADLNDPMAGLELRAPVPAFGDLNPAQR